MSIFKMKDGERSRWVVQAYHKNKKFRVYTNPKTKKTITSYKEAQAVEAMLLLSFQEPRSDEKPVRCKELYELFYLELRKTLKSSSVFARVRSFKKHVAPQFDHFLVKDVTNADLDRMNDEFNLKSYGAIENILPVARRWVKFLRNWNPALLPERFFHFVDSTPHEHIYHVYTLEEERKFLSVIEDRRDLLLFSMLCYYGLRITECIALRYDDFNFEDGSFSVKRIALRKSAAHKLVFTTPKTKRSLRTLRIVDGIKELFPKSHRSDYLFPGEHSEVVGEITVRRLAQRYAKKAGLPPLKIHEFRHSCASNLIRSGFPVRIVAQWLGDTEATVLSFYSHMFPDEKDSISNFFSETPLLPQKAQNGCPLN